METHNIRVLAEENIGPILERAKQKEGRLTAEDAAALGLFCGVIRAVTPGGGPAFPSLWRDWNGDMAAATRGQGAAS